MAGAKQLVRWGKIDGNSLLPERTLEGEAAVEIELGDGTNV